MSSSDIPRNIERTPSISINNFGADKQNIAVTPSRGGTTEPNPSVYHTPKPRGRPTNTQLLQREKDSTRSIRDFITEKRKRSNPEEEDSPEEAGSSDSNARKRPALPTDTSIADELFDDSTPPAKEVSFLPTARIEDTPKMDEILRMLKKMGEENTKQFESMSNQLNQAEIKHENNYKLIQEQLRLNKEEFSKAHKSLEARMLEMENNEKDRDQKIQERFEKLEGKIDSTPKLDSNASKKIEFLERKIETLEKAEIKNNIIIKGIKADPRNLKEELDAFLTKEFEAAGKIVDQRTIKTGSSTMYAVKLDSWATKSEILKKKRQLQGREIYINGELTYKERHICKEVRDQAKKLREDGHLVKVAHKRLEVDGAWHHWDERSAALVSSSQQPIQLSPKSSGASHTSSLNSKN